MRTAEKYGELYLRPMTIEDTDRIVSWRNQDFVRNNFLYRKPFTREGHLEWIRTQVEKGYVVQFMICLKEYGAIGSVYFREIDREKKTAEYGIFLGERELLGRGYGTQAAKCALAYAFGELGLERVFLRYLEENVGARISYERAGFHGMENRKERVCLEDGWHTVCFMELERKEWSAAAAESQTERGGR